MVILVMRREMTMNSETGIVVVVVVTSLPPPPPPPPSPLRQDVQ
jgi:hypothetical protein